MVSSVHTHLLNGIRNLSRKPDTNAPYNHWYRNILDMLQQNARHDPEIVLAYEGRGGAIRTGVFDPVKAKGLSDDYVLSGGFFYPEWRLSADAVSRSGDDHPRFMGVQEVEYRSGGIPVRPLVFYPNIEGTDFSSVELLQEFTHLAQVVWRAERSAFCRLDVQEDLEDVISITHRSHNDSDYRALVTCRREILDFYLSAAELSALRVFCFDISDLDRTLFEGDEERKTLRESNPRMAAEVHLWPAKSRIDFQGSQLVVPLGSRRDIVNTYVADAWGQNTMYVQFTTGDGCDLTCDERELSVADRLRVVFFNAEVLAKYRNDPDKYTVSSTSIGCRSLWGLNPYGVNDAGQVFTFLCKLGEIPYKEQIHWKAHNEQPKDGISQSFAERHLGGRWFESEDNIDPIKEILAEWSRTSVKWWSMSDPRTIERVVSPYSQSQKEWADACGYLYIAVVECFSVKYIRTALNNAGIAHNEDDKSLKLLEKLISERNGSECKLEGLRELLTVRNKVYGHLPGSDAKKLVDETLRRHGSFAGHWQTICKQVTTELRTIERCLKGATDG